MPHLHPSFTTYWVVALVAGLIAAWLLLSDHQGFRKGLARMTKSSVPGILGSGALVIWADAKHHAGLVATAAAHAVRPGDRWPVNLILLDAFVVFALIFTFVIFAFATAAAGRSTSGRGPARGPGQWAARDDRPGTDRLGPPGPGLCGHPVRDKQHLRPACDPRGSGGVQPDPRRLAGLLHLVRGAAPGEGARGESGP
jgi:hypothetical protein